MVQAVPKVPQCNPHSYEKNGVMRKVSSSLSLLSILEYLLRRVDLKRRKSNDSMDNLFK